MSTLCLPLNPSLRQPSPAGAAGRFRSPVRPSTSSDPQAATSPTGFATERVRVGVRLAAGPSARRGRGRECLSRAALLGAARLGPAPALRSTSSTELRPCSSLSSRGTAVSMKHSRPLAASASLSALPALPRLMTASPAPQAPQVPSPDAAQPPSGRFAASSRAQLSRLAAACEGALERQRERQEIEMAWDLDGDGQLDPDELLAFRYYSGGSDAAPGQHAAAGECGESEGRRRPSIVLMRYQAEHTLTL